MTNFVRMMNYNPFNLNGKIIIVTGASSGIGRQCAIQCSLMGASVILLGRSVDRLKDAQKALANRVDSTFYSVDLTNYNRVEEVLGEINLKYGMVDGLVNAAGISTTLPLKVITTEKLNKYYEVNVVSAINLTRIVTRKKFISMKGGSIIFISSVMGVVGEVGKTLYGLTKGAIIAGVKSLALELAARKIRVNCISPGVVETSMSQKAVYSQNEKSLNRVKSLHPLGLGLPEDVANACVFLLSDASRWISGINLIVDGGYTAR